MQRDREVFDSIVFVAILVFIAILTPRAHADDADAGPMQQLHIVERIPAFDICRTEGPCNYEYNAWDSKQGFFEPPEGGCAGKLLAFQQKDEYHRVPLNIDVWPTWPDGYRALLPVDKERQLLFSCDKGVVAPLLETQVLQVK